MRVKQAGWRTRTLVLVTALLDPMAYPAAEVAAAYLRRWRIELCLDDLKTVLGLEALRCKSPAMIHRELLALLVAHNLVRAVMAGAAREHAVALDRLSFTGSLDALLSFAAASAQATTRAQRGRVWAGLLARLAADLVPLRPGRHEPRAVKRRPKSYPHFNRPAATTGLCATAPGFAAQPKLLKRHSVGDPALLYEGVDDDLGDGVDDGALVGVIGGEDDEQKFGAVG